MSDKIVQVKAETLPDLDDLLQCPVCYEIPTGQIFQCNEGHHVCGRCKMRLDVCPVCRALFFGTRNYAMEELIANVKRLRAFKLGGKVTTGSTSSENNTPAVPEVPPEIEESHAEDEENNMNFASRPAFRAPPACKGLFRCLCCKNGNAERLPSARLLNHLRYYHAPELIEGHSDRGEYLQAWQFSTVPGRLVTAVRVADMGIFFLIIEISNDVLCSWLTMAASPWVAHEFCYTITISGNDREAIFSDSVWSVRSCEGSLRKRGHCLVVNGLDARALVAPAMISGKLSVRRVPTDQITHQTQPRAVLRVASRGNPHENTRAPVAQELEPFLQELQNDVERLSRAFASLGREANALVRSEAEMRASIENGVRANPNSISERPMIMPPVPPPPGPTLPTPVLSRSARRRMRQRVRAALNAPQSPQDNAAPQFAYSGLVLDDTIEMVPSLSVPLFPGPPRYAPVIIPGPAIPRRVINPGPAIPRRAIPRLAVPFSVIPSSAIPRPASPRPIISGATICPEELVNPTATTETFHPAPTPSSSGPSNGLPQTENQSRAGKKKRRHRR